MFWLRAVYSILHATYSTRDNTENLLTLVIINEKKNEEASHCMLDMNTEHNNTGGNNTRTTSAV